MCTVDNNAFVLHMGHKVYFEVTFDKNVIARSYFFYNTFENIPVQKIFKNVVCNVQCNLGGVFLFVFLLFIYINIITSHCLFHVRI